MDGVQIIRELVDGNDNYISDARSKIFPCFVLPVLGGPVTIYLALDGSCVIYNVTVANTGQMYFKRDLVT